MGSERNVQETLPLLSNARGRSAAVPPGRWRKISMELTFKNVFEAGQHLKSKKLPPQQSS